MKKILFLLSFILIASAVNAQLRPYIINADSIEFGSNSAGNNTQLRIKNSTRNLTGAFLQNHWDGRTRFAWALDRAVVSNDTLFLYRAAHDTTVVPLGTASAITSITATPPLSVTGFTPTIPNIHIAAASNTDSGYVTNRAQEFSGNKTFNNNIYQPNNPFSASAGDMMMVIDTTNGLYGHRSMNTYGRRFGVSGEDAIGTQNRSFNAASYNFIISNPALFQVANGTMNLNASSTGIGLEGDAINISPNDSLMVTGLENTTYQDKLIGQYSVSGRFGQIILGSNLSLTGGVLSAASSTPGLQSVITQDATLTGNNTIAGGAYNFTYGNMGVFTISQTAKAAVSGANGTAHVSPLTITGGAGGATSYSTGTVTGGNAGSVSITAGNGGAITGTPTTGIGGSGGSVNLLAGDGGIGTTFGGNGGNAELQAGNSGYGTSAGTAGYAALKAGNAGTSSNGNGGTVYIVGGIKDGSGSYGNILLGVSPSSQIRGNVGIGTISPTVKFDVLGAGTAGTNMAARFIAGTSQAAGGVYVGAYNSTYGGFWSANVTPSTSNYALISTGASTVLNSTSNLDFAISDGAAWRINSLKHLVTPTDNTYDIGASGATRPRTGYFGTSIFNPLLIGGTGATSSLTFKTTTGVGTTGADHIWLVGNNGNLEAARILNSGYFGVGRSSPDSKFHVGDGTNYGLRIGFAGTSANYYDADAQYFRASSGSGNGTVMFLNTTSVGIGTSSPTMKLQVASGRFGQAKGANVASAGDLTLGADGNTFHITGTTTINAITTTNWQAGSEIILIFDASVTVKNNTAGGASTATMLLAGGADFSATANDVLKLVYDGTNFYEVSRSVN